MGNFELDASYYSYNDAPEKIPRCVLQAYLLFVEYMGTIARQDRLYACAMFIA